MELNFNCVVNYFCYYYPDEKPSKLELSSLQLANDGTSIHVTGGLLNNINLGSIGDNFKITITDNLLDNSDTENLYQVESFDNDNTNDKPYTYCFILSNINKDVNTPDEPNIITLGSSNLYNFEVNKLYRILIENISNDN